MGTETAAIITAIAAVASAGAGTYAAVQAGKPPPKPKVPQLANTEQSQLAAGRAAALDLSQRRSLATANPTGDLGVTQPLGIARKSLLGQ